MTASTIATLRTAVSRAAMAILLLLALHPMAFGGSASAQQAVRLERVSTFPESFGYLRTVRPLPDGRVMAADPLGQVLAILDLESGAMEPVGREGGGPGEWSQPDAVYALPGDSTLLVDLGNARLSVISPEGRIVRSWDMMLETGAPPMGMDIIQPGGVDARGRVYYVARGGMSPQGGEPDSSRVKRWKPGEETSAAVVGLRPPAMTMSTGGGRNNRSVTMRPVPLAPQDAWAVAPDGSVAVVRAEPYHVEWVGADGAVVRGPDVSTRPVSVGTDEKERYLDEMATSGLSVGVSIENGARRMQFRRGAPQGSEQERAEQLRSLDWPGTLPPIREGGALVAPDGRLWVQRFVAAGDPVTYDLFDRAGRRVASATLPAGRRVVGFVGSRVLAVHVDDLGLNWLEVYRRA